MQAAMLTTMMNRKGRRRERGTIHDGQGGFRQTNHGNAGTHDVDGDPIGGHHQPSGAKGLDLQEGITGRNETRPQRP